MNFSPSVLLDRARSPEGRKLMRYSMVSVIAVAVSQVVLFLAQFWWSTRTSVIVATCVSAIPSYQLNRAWAWGKKGRSDLFTEILPFWGMAILGLILSVWFASFVDSHAHEITTSHLGQKLLVNGAALAAFGLLWVAKFLILNRILFAHRPGKLPLAGDA